VLLADQVRGESSGNDEHQSSDDDRSYGAYRRESGPRPISYDTLQRQEENDKKDLARRQQYRRETDALNSGSRVDREKTRALEERHIVQLRRDSEGGEISDSPESEDGSDRNQSDEKRYLQDESSVFHGKGKSRSSPEPSELQIHQRLEKAQSLEKRQSGKEVSLRKLNKESTNLKGKKRAKQPVPHGCVDLVSDDDDSSSKPHLWNQKLLPAVSSGISVRDLQNLGVVLSFPGHLSDKYWDGAFFRTKKPTGTRRWTGSPRAPDDMINTNTRIGHVGFADMSVEDFRVFVRKGDLIYGKKITDSLMDFLGPAMASHRTSQFSSVWMTTFAITWCRELPSDELWLKVVKMFADESRGIGECRMIFFAENLDDHWTLFAGNTETCEWTWFDALEFAEDPRHWRKTGRVTVRIKKLADTLSSLMNRAAKEFPKILGYAKFKGDWTLHTVHAGQIPVQDEGWSCGQRVLLIADMLASGCKVSDMQTMYISKDMHAIHREMGHYALGRMHDATPETVVGGEWVTSSWH
jgi:hypothetical protein